MLHSINTLQSPCACWKWFQNRFPSWIVPVSSTFLRPVPPLPVVAALAAIITFGSGSFLAQQITAPFPSHQVEIEPELDAAVHRYFETQEKEDVAGYMDMWSSAAQRPSPAMLKFIFDAGDDQYPEVAILRAARTTDGARVRVGALRVRTTTNQQGVVSTSRSRLVMSLVDVKEAGSWKLLKEGPAVDDLAAAIMEATSEEAHEQLLEADKDLVDSRLVEALSRRGTDLVRGRHTPVRRPCTNVRWRSRGASEIASRKGRRCRTWQCFLLSA